MALILEDYITDQMEEAEMGSACCTYRGQGTCMLGFSRKI